MTDIEYSIKLPKTDVIFTDNTLTFAIYNMKSRLPSAVYFILHLYDKQGNEMFYQYDEPVYTMNHRWVVDHTYSTYYHTFTIQKRFVDEAVSYMIEIRADNINSENPLYFNKLMFNEKGFEEEHHVPHEEAKNVKIGFNKARYVNLYDDSRDTYLQVIRPMKGNFTTGEITPSGCTVLAPHINSEQSCDNHIDLFLEFINMREQRIDVLR